MMPANGNNSSKFCILFKSFSRFYANMMRVRIFAGWATNLQFIAKYIFNKIHIHFTTSASGNTAIIVSTAAIRSPIQRITGTAMLLPSAL